MKRIVLFLMSVMLLSTVILNAQTPKRVCGTMDYLQKQITADPSIQTRMDELNQYVEKWVKDHPDYEAKSVITIPVVVHIIYSTTAQNIADTRVIEQINASNADYAAANTHSMQAFSSTLKANTGLQFCLAQRDPSGNATIGIERRQTTHANFGAANDDERHTSKGGLDAWDVTKYFNIWVCDLGTSLCGYSQFPYASAGGGVNANYGSTINYLYFGLTGATAPYNLGGTLTHEMGHCNNLYHTWGDDNGTCTGTDNCTDTPNQSNYTYGAHTGVLTDACTSTSPGIMYTNFMDYSDDISYANFTPNQVARIQALYASTGPLYSLTTSNGCVAPTPGSCGTASGLTAASITTTTATFNWTAVTGASSYNIQYRKSGTTTWTATSSTTNSKAITGLTTATSYEYQVQTVCSSASSSYTSSYTFTTLSTSSCTDIYESNNTAAAAKTIAVNTAITAMIGTSTDVDYFKFTNTTTQKNIKITLTNLPYDYDVKLFKSNGSTLLYTSQNSGTTSETIIYDAAPVATYIIEVYGYKSAYSATKCYTLTANISSSAYKSVEGSDIATTDLNTSLSLYPNPAKEQTTVAYNTDKDCNITISMMDITGRTVSTANYAASKGMNNYPLDLKAINKGLYIIEVSNGSEVNIKKLLVDK